MTTPTPINREIKNWQSRLINIATANSMEDGAHDLNHLHRVWNTAHVLLKEHAEADALVVLAACYLHDLVNLSKNDPQRHLASRQAAVKACAALDLIDFPSDKLSAVAHAIEAHSFSAGILAQSIEAQIVQDADRLDALGAVGLARLFYTAGRMESSLAHPSDPMALQREMDDKRYALDHIEVKLATLPPTMNTVAGRQLGEDRLEWLRNFRDTFVAEWG
ncbi:HD domain-containing protein [Deefgea rivuli]|uniref:HD domain-containing protein n=1 Tax=Deefgea rivuli TaxID=400948 RepID=UPI000A0715A7|nr:HD domain-containing protein [Deefgea rivuli]